jgi:hypothetical protein
VHFVTHFLKTLLLALREMRNLTDEFCHVGYGNVATFTLVACNVDFDI